MTGSLSPLLARLAGERATGALQRDVGTLFLADGVVVHAESPLCPGVDVLLTAGGLPAGVWREAVVRAGAWGRVARYLVERRLLSLAEVQIVGLVALFDAAFFALESSGGPPRFQYGVAHWFGAPLTVPVAALQREVVRRRGLLEAVWPHPALDSAPVVRREAPGLPRVTPRQAALLAMADGSRTPARLAAEHGRPAFDVLMDVRRLAAAGHLVTPPARMPAPAAGGEGAVAGTPGVVGAASVDAAILRRVRDGLETRL